MCHYLQKVFQNLSCPQNHNMWLYFVDEHETNLMSHLPFVWPGKINRFHAANSCMAQNAMWAFLMLFYNHLNYLGWCLGYLSLALQVGKLTRLFLSSLRSTATKYCSNWENHHFQALHELVESESNGGTCCNCEVPDMFFFFLDILVAMVYYYRVNAKVIHLVSCIVPPIPFFTLGAWGYKYHSSHDNKTSQ